MAGRLAALGAVVIDADRLAREVVAPGTEGLAEVVAAFGEGVLTEDGELDRAALAGIVFADEGARQRLNAIIHPRVGQRTAELMAAAPPEAVVVYDVPLLVENRMAAGFHLAVVVDAPVEARVRRLVDARGMSEADARARIAAQATDDQRRAVADVWLDNSGEPGDVHAQVDALWVRRLLPYEENLRLRRYPERGAPRIAPYDPSWPEQAERLVARVRLAAGERALRVDHIGSTSVPGLAAKDVIDLQVTVASLADADALAEPLAEAGFPPLPDLDRDTPHPAVDPDPEHWRKRTHASADPGRWANLHLRVVGSPGWRYALLFPAWLRADEAARAEYEALKRRLAEEHADRAIVEYGRAKDPWFVAASTRAEEWAARTGWTPERP
ncbi:dephospho-CoA kinase (EC 2.7.1.24) [Streptoalloteichus tenebrarius]|uniref:Dephospho-CoA kinase n=1 Tax=Streptoalloteichus tenebrarius (strain ATCC 17920 / DSM 40477 / JCM 4838 / CBS 697.72 / NBRC 16177 / NCIMB 11028 / NRRL B-12390 / A12253. 1 / ISP 5477) TaxID=1933 RepID=A0ABT1I007_STRSD|nr:dephospho-CoA kinase (EC 2.7.1.24) [Streptoalloteichus tenebrarius]BFF03968.1 dephospho-CoA kinase [Streptoalloteichus tenebrarius]